MQRPGIPYISKKKQYSLPLISSSHSAFYKTFSWSWVIFVLEKDLVTHLILIRIGAGKTWCEKAKDPKRTEKRDMGEGASWRGVWPLAMFQLWASSRIFEIISMTDHTGLLFRNGVHIVSMARDHVPFA